MNAKTEYMLLFSGSEWYNEVSASEIKKLAEQAKAWYEGLAQRGAVKGGYGLARTGARVAARTGRVISDGPYPESKEAVGGFIILEAANIEEAVAVAQTNPTVRYGTTIDVRPVHQSQEECPLFRRAREADRELAAAAV